VRRPPAPSRPRARLSDAHLPDPAGIDAPWPGQHVDVDGVRIYVTAAGAERADAEPALLVHGLGGSTNNWTDFIGLIRTAVDVQSLDLPGFGRSDAPPDRDYSLDGQARRVIGYLVQSGRGPVHLVGNSMGGAISILVAAQRPDLVRSLTLLDPAVPDVRRLRVHPLKADWRMAFLVMPVLGEQALRRMKAVPMERRVAATIALCFADPSRYPRRRFEEDVVDARRRAQLPWATSAMLRATRGLVRSQFLYGRRTWAALRRIRTPTLVVWGAQDRLVAPDLAPIVAGALSAARLLELPDVGHVPMLEAPETTARAFLALVEDVASARADRPTAATG
jgi:pimeloyl-ACP methyl ester carboxylesterase